MSLYKWGGYSNKKTFVGLENFAKLMDDSKFLQSFQNTLLLLSLIHILDEYFEYMSIEPKDRDKLLKDYSHGMKNKMQMLINIIAKPNLLLLDEPLTSLDVVVAEEMKQLLRSLKQDRITIFSTHLMDLALDLCDEIVLLNHGELAVSYTHLYTIEVL